MSASVAIGTGVVEAPVGGDAPVAPAASPDHPLPCVQGRVGEGCSPQGELPAANSTLSRLDPPPSLSLQAGGGAGTQHHATVAQPAKPHSFAKPADGPGIGGAVFALILVVSLILGLGWLARRMPGVGRASGNGALRVVGSLSLGPRDRVVVVDVGGTQLLLGVGQNGMTTLHTLAEPLPLAQPSQGTPSLQNLATPFAQLLAKHLGKKP